MKNETLKLDIMANSGYFCLWNLQGVVGKRSCSCCWLFFVCLFVSFFLSFFLVVLLRLLLLLRRRGAGPTEMILMFLIYGDILEQSRVDASHHKHHMQQLQQLLAWHHLKLRTVQCWSPHCKRLMVQWFNLGCENQHVFGTEIPNIS